MAETPKRPKKTLSTGPDRRVLVRGCRAANRSYAVLCQCSKGCRSLHYKSIKKYQWLWNSRFKKEKLHPDALMWILFQGFTSVWKMHFFRTGDLSSQKDAEKVSGTLLQATRKNSGKLVSPCSRNSKRSTRCINTYYGIVLFKNSSYNSSFLCMCEGKIWTAVELRWDDK